MAGSVKNVLKIPIDSGAMKKPLEIELPFNPLNIHNAQILKKAAEIFSICGRLEADGKTMGLGLIPHEEIEQLGGFLQDFTELLKTIDDGWVVEKVNLASAGEALEMVLDDLDGELNSGRPLSQVDFEQLYELIYIGLEVANDPLVVIRQLEDLCKNKNAALIPIAENKPQVEDLDNIDSLALLLKKKGEIADLEKFKEVFSSREDADKFVGLFGLRAVRYLLDVPAEVQEHILRTTKYFPKMRSVGPIGNIDHRFYLSPISSLKGDKQADVLQYLEKIEKMFDKLVAEGKEPVAQEVALYLLAGKSEKGYQVGPAGQRVLPSMRKAEWHEMGGSYKKGVVYSRSEGWINDLTFETICRVYSGDFTLPSREELAQLPLKDLEYHHAKHGVGSKEAYYEDLQEVVRNAEKVCIEIYEDKFGGRHVSLNFILGTKIVSGNLRVENGEIVIEEWNTFYSDGDHHRGHISGEEIMRQRLGFLDITNIIKKLGLGKEEKKEPPRVRDINKIQPGAEANPDKKDSP